MRPFNLLKLAPMGHFPRSTGTVRLPRGGRSCGRDTTVALRPMQLRQTVLLSQRNIDAVFCMGQSDRCIMRSGCRPRAQWVSTSP